jgi:hypothetical protein
MIIFNIVREEPYSVRGSNRWFHDKIVLIVAEITSRMLA